jgi:hypothetical protein
VSPLAEGLAEGLAALVGSCGDAARVHERRGSHWVVEVDEELGLGFEVAHLEDRVELRIADWRGGAELESGDRPDSGIHQADGAELEVLHSILDLAAAALFGDLRLTETLADETVVRWELALATEAGTRVLGSARVGRWRPFAGKSTRVRRNAFARGARYRPEKVEAPPWAPWAGRGGFTRARSNEPTRVPIDGELDLHNFSPKEVKPLVLAYLEEALEEGRQEIRIVHGKGKGVLRRTVHSILEKEASVESFRLGSSHGEGSWGATMVRLRKQGSTSGEPAD